MEFLTKKIDDARFRFLKWDSDFFNLKIGKIEGKKLSQIKKVLSEFSETDMDLLYIDYRAELPDSDNIEGLGNLVDIKYIYELIIPENHKIENNRSVSICNRPSKQLYELAFEAGHESRFKKDPKFHEGEFERFYITWIDNSFNGIMADYVLIYKEGADIAGFITLKLHNHHGEIGLFAVDNNYRRKGIGKTLIEVTKKICLQNGISVLRVATQKNNISACKFYENMGFNLIENVAIFHKWFK